MKTTSGEEITRYPISQVVLAGETATWESQETTFPHDADATVILQFPDRGIQARMDVAPAETPTPTATAGSAPDGESYSFDGDGGDVTDKFSTAGGLTVFETKHDGSDNFIVEVVSSNGDTTELLVNDIGPYDGEIAVYLPATTWQIDVTADGPWEIAVKQPRYSTAEIESLPVDASGTNAAYFGPFRFSGSTEVSLSVSNDEHAALHLTRLDGQRVSLLVNDVGPFETSTLITQEGVGLIVVDTDGGDWDLTVGGD